MDEGFVRGMVFILVLVYIISPVDLVPGPIDDISLLLLTLVLNKEAIE